jgi:hypothetical protein
MHQDDEDCLRAYRRYLTACDRFLGPLEVGEYGVHDRALVQKLDADTFKTRYTELRGLERALGVLLEGGSTVDDVLFQEVQTLASQLLMRHRGDAFDWDLPSV